MKGQQAGLGLLVASTLAVVAWRAMQNAPDEPAVSMAQATDTSMAPRPLTEPTAAAAGTKKLRQTNSTAAVVAVPAPLSRVPISFEHRTLVGTGEDGGDDLHTMFEKEPKDTAWAYETEELLRRLYQETGAQIYSLECRSRTCEVQAFADTGEIVDAVMAVGKELDSRKLMQSMGLSIPVNERQPVLQYFTRVVPREPTEAENEGRRRRQQIMESLKSR